MNSHALDTLEILLYLARDKGFGYGMKFYVLLCKVVEMSNVKGLLEAIMLLTYVFIL